MKVNTIMRVGILGAGNIASKMAKTLVGMVGEAEGYAIASRDLEKAQIFAKEWGFARAYGSYEEMIDDPNVDLVYIATPHAFHYEQALMCVRKHKPVLCEKAFTANARQAEEVLRAAREEGVFVGEAIWTRYMPLSKSVCDLLASGAVGKPMMLSANLGYPLAGKVRLEDPALAGGALLDLGVYLLNFAAMVFGTDINQMVSACTKTSRGLDAQNSVTLTFSDGRMAVLHSTMRARTDRMGIISGDSGHMIVENVNNPQRIVVLDGDYQIRSVYECPKQITGYEYEINACAEALRNGWIEVPDMPHAEILRIMRQMDSLRESWGIRFPFE